jgi:hypothetical protein
VTAVCPRCGASVPAQGLAVSDVGIILAGEWDTPSGLLGWARLQVGPLTLSGLAIRRNLQGDTVVTYPARKDRGGALHREVSVLDADLDSRIRSAVIAAYIDARTRAGRRPTS